MFRAVPLPIIRSFPAYIRYWYMSCMFDDSFQAGPGWNAGRTEVHDEVQEVMTWFKGQAADFYDSGIQKLIPRLNKCLDKVGDCFKK